MSQIQEGSIIAGKFRIERLLARGGMGSVWVARHLQLDMPLAVKFMSGPFAESAEGQVRFEREARAVALIQSPHVVRILDYGIEAGAPYMAMELLVGEDLRTRLRSARRLAVKPAVQILTQVAKALRKAHEAGIVHRDLKPANIFLARVDDDEEIAKVLDFGVAKMTGLGDAHEATQTGAVVGSVHFMSPEQARGSKELDHRGDLWSLGVIAFRLLTGQLPFPGDQIGDVIVKVCSDPIPSARRIAPDLEPEVEVFLTRAMARDPAQRFQSAREMAAALSALADAPPATSGSAWEAPPEPASAPAEPPAVLVRSEPPPARRPAGPGMLSPRSGTMLGGLVAPPSSPPPPLHAEAEPVSPSRTAPAFPPSEPPAASKPSPESFKRAGWFPIPVSAEALPPDASTPPPSSAPAAASSSIAGTLTLAAQSADAPETSSAPRRGVRTIAIAVIAVMGLFVLVIASLALVRPAPGKATASAPAEPAAPAPTVPAQAVPAAPAAPETTEPSGAAPAPPPVEKTASIEKTARPAPPAARPAAASASSGVTPKPAPGPPGKYDPKDL
jgi:eukaryotic-like serine/threonine-protein kinase